MASEYLRQKAQREAPPPEQPIVYTKKEKIRNWLHYNWYWFAVGAVVLWIVGSMLWNILGIGRVKPDYRFAYVGKTPIPTEQAEALETALASLGVDQNGDGQVKIELRQYIIGRSGDAETVLSYNRAADTQLLADMTTGDSYFFLTDDPDSLQRSYQILAKADGSAPDERDYTADGKAFLWTDCSTLTALPVEQNVFSGLSLGRRYFAGSAAQGHQADDALWKILTKGAKP